MRFRTFLALVAMALGTSLASVAGAQTLLSEDFTDVATSNTGGVSNWLVYNGACLTAGTSTLTPASSIPACTTLLSSYYNVANVGGVTQKVADPYLTGGYAGYLGGTSAPGSVGAQKPDPRNSGALRFTNTAPGGNSYGTGERGAIVSTNPYPANNGIQVTFKTVTYNGDSGQGQTSGGVADGADGISFFVIDGCMPVAGATLPSGCPSNPIYGTGQTFPAIGATGGSLAYSCSNGNPPYDGLVGAYLGVGIDEYGNFLNGATNSLGSPYTQLYAPNGDNTHTGGFYQGSRFGIRGAGSVSWQALNTAYGGSTNPGSTKPWYPSTLSSAQQQAAVQNTCITGKLWNYSNPNSPTAAGPADLTNSVNTAKIQDYAAIASQVPSGFKIANESARNRPAAAASVIYYNLQITQDGLLSLSYAPAGGSYIPVITNQNIVATNGPLPSYVRFGFAGSTGGSTNIHEILCFKATPAAQAASSAGVNEKQSAKIQSGTFAYFAYYDPNNWVGRLTANALSTDTTTGGVDIATTPTWDASCVLTGIPAGQTCLTGVSGTVLPQPVPSSRVILTWNNAATSPAGVAFEWTNLTSSSPTQQSVLDVGDPSPINLNRLNFLRGDRTNEISTTGTCPQLTATPSMACFRARDSLLGDVVDSSPTWEGPPQSPYTATWKDRLYAAATPAENSGTQSYLQFVSAMQTRPNVVYVGANDGMLHGFRSGAYDSSGNFTTATVPNDGQEVLAYVPGAVLQSPAPASGSGGCTSSSTTGSIVQNIHGVTPAVGSNTTCTTTELDFANTQYGHNFFVDATPGTGDLFYGGIWHTWLVGGLGAGGAAIYALDVTNPSTTNTASPTYYGFTESNASHLVVGEWTSANIPCSGNSTCGVNLGNTFGTPIIRRLHDGLWAVIFGNGFGSRYGDAGIYVMTVDSSGTKTFYYLSTSATQPSTDQHNGIAYVTSADLDGDHITDYIYAGDLKGNVWRFDLTSQAESNWKVSPGPLFKSTTGQPITTAVVVASGATAAGTNTLMVAFGTGQRWQPTNTSAVSYATTTTQSLYGVWDWNMSAWNTNSSTQYAALTTAQLASLSTGLSSPGYTLNPANLAAQGATLNGTTVDSTVTSVCWMGSSGCTGSTGKFGWSIALQSTQEQILYNPQVLGDAFQVNSTVPANNNVLSCTVALDTGFSYGVSMLTGAPIPNFFTQYHDTSAIGELTNATGTSFPVTSASGQTWLVYQTVSNTPSTLQVSPHLTYVGHRVSWVQLR